MDSSNDTRALLPEVEAHFLDTTGPMSDTLRALADFNPEYFAKYAAIRAQVYAPDSPVDARTRELLFVMLAAMKDNPAGARSHMQVGKQAGMTLADVRQVLLFLMFELGADAWVNGGYAIWRTALEVFADD